MVFQLETSHKIFGIQLPTDEIAKNVSANLAEWGYSFKPTSLHDYSHDLTASISSVSYGSTPFGLSFGLGTSNPRSPNFQKANVFSITCSLVPKGQQESAELIMEIKENNYRKDASNHKEKKKIIDLLTNDISTACYNLLSSLNIKTQQKDGLSQKSKPNWIPEIRIEIENIPASSHSATNKTTKITSLNSTPPLNSEPRKRIIINNQGSPVIFKFGPDR